MKLKPDSMSENNKDLQTMAKKGHTNNPNGRPPGVPNKVTYQLREKLKDLLDAEIENMPTALKQLPPDRRLEMVIRLMPYVFPKVETVCLPDRIENYENDSPFSVLKPPDWL